MSVESEKAPVKQTFNFSSDPSLIPSRLVVSFDDLKLNQPYVSNKQVVIPNKQVRLGRCEPMQILVANAKNVAVPLLGGISVDLSSGNTADEFYLSKDCTGTKIVKLTLNQGDSSKEVYYKPKALGSRKIAASHNMFSVTGAAVNVLAVPVKLDITNLPRETIKGVCSSAFKVRVLNGSDLPTPISLPGPGKLQITSSSGIQVFPNSNCSEPPVSPVPLSEGVSESVVPLSKGVSESVELSFKALKGSFTGPSMSIPIGVSFRYDDVKASNTPVPYTDTELRGAVVSKSYNTLVVHKATKLQLVPPAPARVNAGVCSSAISVNVQDAFGDNFNEAPRSITFSASEDGGSFYSDSNCSTLVGGSGLSLGANLVGGSGLSLDADKTTAQIYFKSSNSTGNRTLTARSSPLSDGSAGIEVFRKATNLSFDQAPTDLKVQDCSGAFVVSSKDAFGKTFSESPKSISLSSDVQGLFFATASDCLNNLNPISIVSLPETTQATAQVGFYFKITSLTASGHARFSAISNPLSVNSNQIPISRLAFDSSFSSDGRVNENAGGEISVLTKYGNEYLAGGQFNGRAYLRQISPEGALSSVYVDSDSRFSNSKINAVFVEGNVIYFVGHAVQTDGNQNWIFGKWIPNVSLAVSPIELGANTDSAIGIESISTNQVAIIGNQFEVQRCNKSDLVCDCLIPDTSLGTCTSAAIRPPAGSTYIAKKTAKDSSGKIWAVGSTHSKMAVLKLDPSALGTSLGSPLEPWPTVEGVANSIAFDRINRAVIVGGTSNQFLAITRLNNNLSMDTTFGNQGLIQDAVTAQGVDIVIESEGAVDNLLIAANLNNQMLIRRYQPDGSFISPNSSNSNPIPFNPNSIANRVLRDGFKILLGGSAGGMPALARIHP